MKLAIIKYYYSFFTIGLMLHTSCSYKTPENIAAYQHASGTENVEANKDITPRNRTWPVDSIFTEKKRETEIEYCLRLLPSSILSEFIDYDFANSDKQNVYDALHHIDTEKDRLRGRKAYVWNIFKKDTDRVLINRLHSATSDDEEVFMMVLKRKEKKTILCLFFRTVKNYNYLFLELKGNCWEEINMQIPVNINDFYVKPAFPESDSSHIIVYYDQNKDKLIADLYTWMESDFENLTQAYRIELKWDGEKFNAITAPYKTP